ncbi:hypothetical protein [Paraferrimonas haliotis]|uniref:Uncharacterized protein n=1 Tax=Paraferrimonas haliotis TaxID=2013866 RepID=A0AA37TMY7_9GAMM|nr:hypothetical protein [Paraferrimonas haliotis]GLS83323.1 hypothetical protein GCM10007894_13000 [Paraferrimonas haliotis]
MQFSSKYVWIHRLGTVAMVAILVYAFFSVDDFFEPPNSLCPQGQVIEGHDIELVEIRGCIR